MELYHLCRTLHRQHHKGDKLMPVYLDKSSNTYFVSKCYADPLTLKSKRICKRGFSTRKDAIKFESKFNINLRCAQSTNYNVEVLVDMFLDYKKERVKSRTYYDIKKIADKHITPTFKHLGIKDIKPSMIEHWQKQLLENNYSNDYLEAIQGLFSRIFNYCISKEIVDTNPVKIVGFVKNQTKSSKKLQFYTTDQYIKFRGVIDDERYLLVFDLLYFTGMRISELQARTWSDLNFDEKSLIIHSNYDCKNHVITPSTKNGETRVIYLSDDLINQLNKRYTAMKRYKNFDPTKFYIISDLSILSQKTISNNKKYILDCYNDTHPDDQLPKIRIHDFRHSHVSMLINSEVDTFTIAERLGHSKQMVENVYGHLFPSKKKEILNVLNNVQLTPQTAS